MSKSPNPTSLARQHRYEINFSLTNPTHQGARHVANGQGRFVGTPYDSSDLEAACLTLARAAPTDPLRDEHADRLRRFIGRAEKLLDKKIARLGFLFPSLRMTAGAVNAQEIKEQIGEEWDAVAHRLRPFINQELKGENITISSRGHGANIPRWRRSSKRCGATTCSKRPPGTEISISIVAAMS